MKIRSTFIKLVLSGSLSFGLLFPHASLTWALSALAPDAPPIAVDDSYTTVENTLLTISAPGVLQNDVSDVPGSLVANLVAGTSNGTLTFNSNGSFSYRPALNFLGTDVFTYTATNSDGTSNQATVSLTVTPNHPPSAVSDQVSTPEDTPVLINVLANDSDPDGNLDTTTVSIMSGTTHGTTSVDPLTGNVTYTPNLYFHGQDGFVYQVCDTLNACNTATVIIDVLFFNHSPVANDDVAPTPTYEDIPVVINVMANDTDVDGNLDPTTVRIVRQAGNGTTTVNPTTGSVTYLSNSNYNGVDSFRYQVCDTGKPDPNGTPPLCDTADVSVTVTPVNDHPIANDDSTSTQAPSVTMDVLANDTDPDGVADLVPSSVTVVTPASHGSTTVNPANGEITYTPYPPYSGLDSFRYRVYDHGGLWAEANVAIDVTWVNRPPASNPDSGTTPEDTAFSINVAANDTDPDNNLNPSSVKVVSGPTNGSATLISPPGTILYTPDLNFNGVDSFVYQVCDTGGTDHVILCDSATVTVTVTPVNDRPVAMDDTYFMNQDTTLSIDALSGVLENDSDVDGDKITAVLDNSTTYGKLDLKSDGSFTYVPKAAFAGPDTFTYRAYDGSAWSDPVTVIITVIDTQPPRIVQWLQPSLDNDKRHYVDEPIVTLEVTATDNVAVDHVRFSRWDPVISKHVDIASVQVAPYIYELDARTLKAGWNQVYARAYDPSGNDSGQDNFIWLILNLYLPVLIR